jgi:putative ABC transport system permease protein
MTGGIVQDVMYAVRSLRGNPGFALTAIAMLAVGIGVNATVFTVTNAVLFKGFPLVQRNDRLVYISNGGCCISYPDFQDYRAQSKSFQGMGIVHGIEVAYSDAGGYTESVVSNENSAEVFKLVGQRPILGRDFTEADEQPGASPVAILNYSFWESRYAKDPKVIGHAVRINGAPGSIIGVMPEGFSFPQNIDIWLPLVKTPQVLDRGRRDTWFAFGRLKDGVTFESAKAEIEAIGKRISLEFPLTNKDWQPVVGHFHEFFIGPNAAVIYGSMWGAVGFVLLIACANLANLLLAKAIGRSREISVRIALGASRWRIIRQLLIESVMLSAVGGFLGWWIAKWGVSSYAVAMSQKSSWLVMDYRMEQDVVWYLIAISIGTGLLFGLAPALRLSKLDVNSTLKDGARGATGGGHGKHLSALLVTGEMALAIVLLAGAGVMIRSFLKAHNADLGVNTANIVAGQIDLSKDKYPSVEQKIAFYDRLAERLQSAPGVVSVAMAAALPTSGAFRYRYEIPGLPVIPRAADERSSTILELTVSASYFRTLEAKVLSGRDFSETDVAASPRVAIVNQLFAAKYWPREDPLGKRIRFLPSPGRGNEKPGEWMTVVGVVSNIIQNDITRQRFDPVIYVPYRQNPGGGAYVLVKTQLGTGALMNTFRREVQALDPDLPIFGPFDMASRLERFWDSRFYGSLFLVFAAVALLLASIGLYTVISHSVSRRTQEIGVRMAVGASSRDVLALVFKQGMLPLAIGLSIGLIASLAVNRLLKSLLVQVSPSDPISLGVSAGVLILAAALGCWIPARRAMRVDPVVALRHE